MYGPGFGEFFNGFAKLVHGDLLSVGSFRAYGLGFEFRFRFKLLGSCSFGSNSVETGALIVSQ